jgi:hypothetical protein
MWHNAGEIPGNGLDDEGNGYVDDYFGYDVHNDDGDPMDDDSHGTHVAGTIGMVGNNGIGSAGVNWDVKIMAVKMIGGGGANQAQVVAAYDYVTMMRLRGVNVRLTNESFGSFGYGKDFEFYQANKDASEALGAAGILEVAAAMNEMTDMDGGTLDFIPARFEWPHIISVAATDHDDRIAAFSNWGAQHVDLAAPGVDIYSTVPGGGYALFSGTSMATPHVAGAAALIWSAFPSLTAAQVKARLLNGVDPIAHIGANAGFPTVTNGRLNVRNALLVDAPDAGDTTAPAPVGNLTAAATSPWSVKLNWTASGDDGVTGRAGFYDVRYSTSPITAANFASATRAPGEPAPATAGSAETLTVTGLDPGTVYYFAVNVADNAHNAATSVAQGATTAAKFLLNDGVESAASPWTATGMWHRSTRRGHDSATGWYYGDEATGTYFNGTQDSGTLTLATPIDLTGVSQAMLRFDEWRQVSNEPPLDVARLQLSRDGVNWDTASESFSATLDWQQRAVDLTPYAGAPVHVRFEFNKNAFDFLPFAITRGHEGWHIDNVRVLVPSAQPAGISVNDVTLSEGSGGTTQATFTLTRSSGNGRASVRYATANGSATAGAGGAGDYVATSGLLSFANGETRKTVTVNVNSDFLGEPDESFLLNLSNATGAVIADASGRAALLDDEPRIHINSDVIFPEGNEKMTLVLRADLTAASTQTITVNYATADATAVAKQDYAAVQGVLTFAPGQTMHKIAIEFPKDKKVEDLIEYFTVELANASPNAVILKRGIVHIVDDDVPPGSSGATATIAPARIVAATAARAASMWSTLRVANGEDDGDDDALVAVV